MGSHLSVSVCAIQVQARLYQLRVECAEEGDWSWTLRTREGHVLEGGRSESKVAAQVTAQLAFERRLNLSGLSRTVSAEHNGYQWTDASPDE